MAKHTYNFKLKKNFGSSLPDLAPSIIDFTVKDFNEMAAKLKDEYRIEPAAQAAVMIEKKVIKPTKEVKSGLSKIIDSLQNNNSSEVEKGQKLSEIINNLQDVTQKSIHIVDTIFEAFDLNSEGGGEDFYISRDEYFDLSIKAVLMLDKFQKLFFSKNMASINKLKIEKANGYALNTVEKIEQIKENFVKENKKITLEKIAVTLKEQEHQMPAGGLEWTATAVRRIVNRAAEAKKDNNTPN